METKILVIAAVLIAATAALAIAPSLSAGNVLATKTPHCENGGGHTKDCSSPSVKTETCTAGNPPKPNSPNCSGT
jgi:hypothetical protein